MSVIQLREVFGFGYTVGIQRELKVFVSGAICHRSAVFCITTYPIIDYIFAAGNFQT